MFGLQQQIENSCNRTAKVTSSETRHSVLNVSNYLNAYNLRLTQQCASLVLDF